MKKTALFVSLFFIGQTGLAFAADSAGLIEVVPSVKVSQQDEALLRDNHTLLVNNQELVKKILQHEGLAAAEPVLPKLHLLSGNSVLALINQMDYRALAHKLSVEDPRELQAASGDALANNHFHHLYNNTLLRKIAAKLGVDVPAAVESKGSMPLQSNELIKQNSAMLTGIAKKLGVS